MNCRDCNKPMRQWAADNWYCEACRLEAREVLMVMVWKRHPPAYLNGMVISVKTPDGEWIADAANWRQE